MYKHLRKILGVATAVEDVDRKTNFRIISLLLKKLFESLFWALSVTTEHLRQVLDMIASRAYARGVHRRIQDFLGGAQGRLHPHVY